jgi:glyoxylase-like metal-dependent hydrolase (beta-lactamase superfamily II)
VTFFINADTGELTKLATLELDFYRRDVALEIFYGNWTTTDDLPFPRSVRVARAGHTLFSEEIDAVTVNPAFEAATFDFPADVAPRFDAELYERGELSHQWYYLLDSIGLPFSGVDVQITPTEIGSPRVLQLAGASHHSFVVEQEDGLVLVDAPLHDDRGGALVEFLDTFYPGVAIKDVVVSHFHEDHVSGIREVLGRTGANLIVHASTEAFWRELLAAPSTLKPDALAQNPREVSIETVPEGGELEIADAANPVVLYHLATAHAADMLLTYQPTSNSVFVVDIYSPGNPTQLGADDLDAALTEHAIPTEGLTIVGGHGGTSDYAALQAQLP